jgi:hypothetical protein
MVWQLSMQNGYLSSNCDDPSMTFQYPVDISRDLVSMTSQFSQQSMEVHGIGLVCSPNSSFSFSLTLLQIEKLFDVACSLTDVLSLLPPNPDPFQLGPQDYLHDFMTLLSVLRNGDNRFLPLLLAKVNDVLPRLVNPMLQTVPDTPATMCADVDIFDGFGSNGIGVPSNFPGYNGNGTSGGDFKIEPDTDFNRNTVPGLSAFDKRIEELGSPSTCEETVNSPFTSPPIIQSPMEFPGLGDYGGFPDLSSPMPTPASMHNSMGNYGEGVGGGGQVNFKREFDPSTSLSIVSSNSRTGMEGVRRPPLRQGSSGSFGMQIPRSVPEQFHQLHRANSGESVDLGMSGAGDLPFR